MSIFSASVLNSLPFSKEPFNKWNDHTDLLQFLYEILNDNYTVTNEDGRSCQGNYRNLAPHYFKEGQQNINEWIHLFTDGAAKAYPKPENFKEVYKSDFENDPVFGQASKYFIAWERVTHNALEETMYFSLPHLLETEFDIKCSFRLAADLYYKQALQVLRGFLESLVLPVYFCEYPTEFSKWKEDNYRVPPMRGKQGLLKKLSDKQIISTDLAEEVSFLYESLNSYIHGNEKRLISKGLFTGDYRGYVFKEDDFKEWCASVSQAIYIGIRLFTIHLEQWRIKSAGLIICSVCHQSDFDVKEEITLGGQKNHHYKCLHCGEEMGLTEQSK